MKKVLLLFALVAISAVSINAQDNLKWGVMAGMNVSKYTITGFADGYNIRRKLFLVHQNPLQ